MKTVIKYFIVVLITGLISCKKDEVLISNTPEIKFASVTPTSYPQYSGDITFTIFYKDGDGDMGEDTPDAKNLFLTDSRNNVTYKYRVQQLAPSGSSIAIEGNLNIVLSGTGITDASTSQIVTYSIYVTDRAGNKSNTVTSDAITITQ